MITRRSISRKVRSLSFPAQLTARQTKQVREVAIRAFQAMDGAGMGRVDFLLDRKTGKVYLNEINTIPGFTSISMYPKLWEASGVPYPELLDRLIELALERHQEKSRTRFTYSPKTTRITISSFCGSRLLTGNA